VTERRVRLVEALGVTPVRERWRQALVALRGEVDVPPSRFDRSSLFQLRPRLSVPLWLGRCPVPRTVLITNLFNHRQTPIAEGWSVRRRQMLDFRGGALTYDSHNGTDFAVPVGTTVLTAAPGRVVRLVSEFNRGGLKIFVDHGRGLMTAYAHLARALVVEGQALSRGEPLALSGYSGLDGFATFPWGVPHVHFNVWLNGEPIDPFARDGEVSLWQAGAHPAPPPQSAPAGETATSRYRESAVEDAIAACTTDTIRERLYRERPLARRAAATLVEMNYYPTRFSRRVCVYDEVSSREARLDLPFSGRDFDGVQFAERGSVRR
jgi:murein DD-endopeptidase